MPIRFRCANCQAEMRIGSQSSGKIVTCPRCTQALIVPKTATEQPMLGVLIDENGLSDNTFLPNGDRSSPVEKDWQHEQPPSVAVASESTTKEHPPTFGNQSEGPIERDWQYDEPPSVHEGNEEGPEFATQQVAPRAGTSWLRFILILALFNIVPAIIFGYVAEHYWNTNRVAAIVALSGCVSAVVISCISLLMRIHRR